MEINSMRKRLKRLHVARGLMHIVTINELD